MYLVKRCIEELGELQEVRAAGLCRLGGQTGIIFHQSEPVHMLPERLSVQVELQEGLIHLWDEEKVFITNEEEAAASSHSGIEPSRGEKNIPVMI